MMLRSLFILITLITTPFALRAKDYYIQVAEKISEENVPNSFNRAIIYGKKTPHDVRITLQLGSELQDEDNIIIQRNGVNLYHLTVRKKLGEGTYGRAFLVEAINENGQKIQKVFKTGKVDLNQIFFRGGPKQTFTDKEIEYMMRLGPSGEYDAIKAMKEIAIEEIIPGYAYLKDYVPGPTLGELIEEGAESHNWAYHQKLFHLAKSLHDWADHLSRINKRPLDVHEANTVYNMETKRWVIIDFATEDSYFNCNKIFDLKKCFRFLVDFKDNQSWHKRYSGLAHIILFYHKLLEHFPNLKFQDFADEQSSTFQEVDQFFFGDGRKYLDKKGLAQFTTNIIESLPRAGCAQILGNILSP